MISPCLSGGLWDAVTISIGTRHVANWLIGQVLDERADYDRMLLYADEIGADRTDLAEVRVAVQRMSSKQFQNVQQAREISRREWVEADLSAAYEQITWTEEELASNSMRSVRQICMPITRNSSTDLSFCIGTMGMQSGI